MSSITLQSIIDAYRNPESHRYLSFNRSSKSYVFISERHNNDNDSISLNSLLNIIEENLNSKPKSELTPQEVKSLKRHLAYMSVRKNKHAYSGSNFSNLRWLISRICNYVHGLGFMTSAERALALAKRLETAYPPPPVEPSNETTSSKATPASSSSPTPSTKLEPLAIPAAPVDVSTLNRDSLLPNLERSLEEWSMTHQSVIIKDPHSKESEAAFSELISTVRARTIKYDLKIPEFLRLLDLQKISFLEKITNQLAPLSTETIGSIEQRWPICVEQDQISFFKDIWMQKYQAFKFSNPNQEAPQFFDQLIHNLVEFYKYRGLPEKDYWPIVKEQIKFLARNLIKMDSNYQGLTTKTAFCYYHLINQLKLFKASTHHDEKGENLIEIKSPGDGNCFLWSCVISKTIDGTPPDQLKLEDFINFSNKSKKHAELKLEQEGLRKEVAKKFREIRDQDTPFTKDLLQRLALYMSFNREFEQYLPEDEQKRTTCIIDGQPTDVMIEGYLDILGLNGSWNGEFEAAIVAEIYQRQIMIFKKGADGLFKYHTSAGDQFAKSNLPIRIKFTPGHYDALAVVSKNQL